MIISKIQHGLGNQLFQYAIGLSLAAKNKTVLKLDLSWYENNNYRQYSLFNFSIREFIATRDEINLFFCNQTLLRVRNKITKKYNDFFHIQHFPYPVSLTYLQEKPQSFASEILDISGDIYLEGFWLSYKYILPEIEDRLRFELKPTILKKKIVGQFEEKIFTSSNSVAVHIRRGDYISREDYRKKYASIDFSYYKKALDILNEKFGLINIFIFTDDPTWVGKNFPLNQDYLIISGNGLHDFEELYLMSKCCHQVIANSTYSWWGAWLNDNPQKVVIAPKIWMNDASIDSNNLILPDWISI